MAPEPAKKFRPSRALLLVTICAFALCASCARYSGADAEQRVTVRGQYDVSFGYAHR
jgi:hypothetical protein